MTQQHPITPPPELVEQWLEELYGGPVSVISPFDQRVLIAAAQWGADCQLEADAEWLDRNSLDAPHLTITPTGKGLVEAMRSKAPSLKEQALDLLDKAEDPSWDINDFSIIRRALEALPDSIVVFPSQC
jgi:hypothetical protein